MATKAQAGKAKGRIRAANERQIVDAAEQVFAEHGFRGATTALIADRAGIPKPNLHYYFPTKEALYHRVIEDVVAAWDQAATNFDTEADPAVALGDYIDAKMDLARIRPLGSRIWAMEVIRGAPVMEEYLSNHMRQWLRRKEAVIKQWIDDGRMPQVEPRSLFFMIWATTQHYADFGHQVEIMNGGKPFSDRQFAIAKKQVREIILKGIGLG